MPYSSTPCGRASPKNALQGWPTCKVGSLQPSSTPLDTPHRTHMLLAVGTPPRGRRWPHRIVVRGTLCSSVGHGKLISGLNESCPLALGYSQWHILLTPGSRQLFYKYRILDLQRHSKVGKDIFEVAHGLISMRCIRVFFTKNRKNGHLALVGDLLKVGVIAVGLDLFVLKN
jgi:hypothetical protein